MKLFPEIRTQFHLPEWLTLSFTGLALLGFFDALFLTWHHFAGVPVPCSVTAGCEAVLTSSYAVWYGVPLALIGLLYYFCQFILMIGYYISRNPHFFIFCVSIAFVGFLSSIGFVYLQFFVINALCAYCLFSAFISTILFIFSTVGVFRYRA